MPYKILDESEIKMVLATIEQKPIIKNLARFYVYEFSRYSGEDIPEDGLFVASETCFNFSDYWSKAGHYPFVIFVKNKLAGFILINKKSRSSDIDWHLAEFYIIAKFQRKGIGRKVAITLLSKFTGTWEIGQIAKNLPAVNFWRSVIQQFTKGEYTEQRDYIQYPRTHEMIIQKFQSPKNFKY